MDVQIPTKLRRNAPCPCGSGRKFKKCCGLEKHKMEPSEEEMLKDSKRILKNEFRDEIRDPYAGIPEDELVTRDQAVLLKELRFRKFVRELNNTSLEIVINKAKELLAELLAMTKSPYREVCIANTKKMLENNQNVFKANLWPIESEVTLLALEELFAETEEVDKVKELAKPFGPMIRPVDKADMEDEEDLTIDEEDNPEEVI